MDLGLARRALRLLATCLLLALVSGAYTYRLAVGTAPGRALRAGLPQAPRQWVAEASPPARLALAGPAGLSSVAGGRISRTVAVYGQAPGGQWLRPGDRVDLEVALWPVPPGRPLSSLVGTDVEVLALVAVPAGVAQDRVAALVTLSLLPEEAARLDLAEARGRVRLVLRGRAPKAP